MPSSNSQRVGTIAEVEFVRECLERDFEPHPTTTPMPWDFLVSCPKGILKIQVKCTTTPHKKSAYKVGMGSGCTNKAEMSRDIDLLACYVMPVDLWWIIPRIVVGPCRTINLFTSPISKSRFKQYQNNWSLFY